MNTLTNSRIVTEKEKLVCQVTFAVRFCKYQSQAKVYLLFNEYFVKTELHQLISTSVSI